MPSPLRLAVIAGALLAVSAAPTAAQAATSGELGGRRIVLAAPSAPGPARLNRIYVRQYGPRDARTVLVLTPGSPGGQGNYAALAPALVARVPDLAVWAVDRRANALEDLTGFRARDPEDALGYYLFGQRVGGRTFTPVADDEAAYVRRWGVHVALADLRRVVLTARAGGRRQVILGGHSAGAVTVPTYAAWDFAGRPGYRDLAGMLLIDGGQFGAFSRYLRGTPFFPPWITAAQARAGLAWLRRSSPFGIAGAPLPVPLWLVGVLPELACRYALAAPDAPSTLQALVPQPLRPFGDLPEFPVTNAALFGSLVTSNAFPAFDMRLGRLAGAGNPRPWIDGPFASVRGACRTFVQEPGNGLEWHYPVRLDAELFSALTTLRPTPATRLLGLRPFHLDAVDTPLYVFETGLSKGGVLRAARRFIRESSIRAHRLVSDPAMGHFDPLEDVPARNRFVQTVVPFLRAIATRAGAFTGAPASR